MVSADKLKKLGYLLKEDTSDIKMIRRILLDLKTDEEIDQLISFIEN